MEGKFGVSRYKGIWLFFTEWMQLYIAIYTEVKRMFPGRRGGRELHQPSLRGVAEGHTQFVTWS